MTISDAVIKKFQSALKIPETGGILGVNGNVVSEFHHDNTGTTTERNYIPDIDSLNAVLRDWKRRGIEFVGFVHSHHADKKISPTSIFDTLKKSNAIAA